MSTVIIFKGTLTQEGQTVPEFEFTQRVVLADGETLEQWAANQVRAMCRAISQPKIEQVV